MGAITDPSWFYSSLAQVSASIIGLIGAVFGSKLIDRIVVIREERRNVERDVFSLSGNISTHLSDLQDFRAFLISFLEANDAAQASGETERYVSQRRDWGSSGGGSPWRINVSEEGEKARDNLLSVERVVNIYRPLSGRVEVKNVTDLADALENAIPQLNERGKSFVQNDIVALRLTARHIDAFLATTSLKLFVMVLIVLMWLAVTCLIWPLAALPGIEDYPKTWMLIFLAMGLMAFLIFISSQLIEIRSLRVLNWERE